MAPTGVWQLASSCATTARSHSRRVRDGRVVERPRAPRARASSPARVSSASSPWPGAGTKRRGSSTRARLVVAPEPPQPGEREHDRVVVARRRACAGGCRRCRAASLDLEVGPHREQLRAPAQAGRADATRPRGSASSDAAPTERVARVLGRRHGGDLEARRAARPARPWRCGPRGRRRRASSASSISLTKRDLSPSAAAPRSPDVMIGTSSTPASRRRAARRPPRAPGPARARCPACRSAAARSASGSLSGPRALPDRRDARVALGRPRCRLAAAPRRTPTASSASSPNSSRSACT